MADTRSRPARLLKEARLFRELPRLFWKHPQPTKVEHPALVVLVPGLGAADLAMRPLATFLRTAGHLVFDSDLGFNLGSVNDDIDFVEDRVAEITDIHRRRAALVGWSLGGVIAREVARRAPDRIDQVITFGSPLKGPRYTSLSFLYGDDRTREIERSIEAAERNPITVPITVMYSRDDGIVDWRSCVDERSPNVTNVEVDSAHLAMNLDPDVWGVVEKALAERPAPPL